MLREPQSGVERDERVSVHIPIRYRIPLSPEWLTASTENVSRSGILFQSESDVNPGMTMDLILQLPWTSNKVRVGAEVVCRGEVARVEKSSKRICPAIGVAIHRVVGWHFPIPDESRQETDELCPLEKAA
jgi:hypothetical protein